MLFPELLSVDDISLCGTLEYEFKSPDQLTSSTMLFSDTAQALAPFAVDPSLDGIITLVKEAPSDNSAPIEVTIQTNDYNQALPYS